MAENKDRLEYPLVRVNRSLPIIFRSKIKKAYKIKKKIIKVISSLLEEEPLNSKPIRYRDPYPNNFDIYSDMSFIEFLIHAILILLVSIILALM